jgi:signal transduction histidine kinase
MTIRRTLLVFFLLMGLAPATLLTGLAFFQARQALELEITRNLNNEAAALMTQIDRILFERAQNVHTWSQLEIMQEVRVGDVDKRLSHFLFDLKNHYQNVYKNLFCSNRAELIAAASNPALIGAPLPAQHYWLNIAMPDGETTLAPLIVETDEENPVLEMDADIAQASGRESLGTLHVQFDWGEIFRLLDQSRKNFRTEDAPFLAMLFDGQGRIIAATLSLRERGLLFSGQFAGWRKAAQGSAVIADPDGLLGMGEVLAGLASSQGYQNFAGFGWSVLVLQPTAVAFAPVERMAAAFFFLLALTSAAAVALSLLIANRIARPITQLTALTRRFSERQEITAPAHAGPGEVGELTHSFVCMFRDLEKSREDLVRAAKLAVVGEMAAAMAHEVRTPLGIIRSSAQMLQREPRLSPTGQEMLGFMLGESDRLNHLVSTLLDCARPRPPLFQPQRLHAIAQRAADLLSMQARKKNIRLRLDCQTEQDWLTCDEEQIMQVLLNLLMNALQITPQGGEVLIRIQHAAALTLDVDDTGPGLRPEHQARAFDPFFTQREGGIGLGLTIVQQIVKAHHAEISIGASPAGGARFRIVFPNPTLEPSAP